MSEYTIDYVLIPTLSASLVYGFFLTITLLAVGNGWMRKGK